MFFRMSQWIASKDDGLEHESEDIKLWLPSKHVASHRWQRANTRAHALLSHIDDKAKAIATRYNTAHNALITLKGTGDCGGKLKTLSDKHIDLDYPTGKQRKKKSSDVGRGLGEGYHVILWIWHSQGVLAGRSDAALNETVHVEWAKSRACELHWKKEVLLLKEEMQHAEDWKMLPPVENGDNATMKGAAAYAHQQVAIQQYLLEHFEGLWG
ncbi:hypothetical protein PAXRUDRAFT_36389 [Paxillus rubicundulus Ve08.2h10]|uniref:Uncharacterized protein n=1 Tax=Paxillus rubicundulus Ve08.2h10 TaxID=930991 RepID=A0A0D0D7K4_9AGAM|nr:hypothetical protein PAXRUDRAFT_36389 [Paxillus rubicundulus Ve08.2h10]